MTPTGSQAACAGPEALSDLDPAKDIEAVLYIVNTTLATITH